MSLYWNDSELIVEPYERKTQHYHCGKKLLRFEEKLSVAFTLFILDLSECYCARVFSDGTFEKVLSETSFIHSKHRKGGQSASRFQRGRDEAITQWFKKVTAFFDRLEAPIHLVTSFVYKDRVLSHMSNINKAKISKVGKCQYTGEIGAHQYIKQL